MVDILLDSSFGVCWCVYATLFSVVFTCERLLAGNNSGKGFMFTDCLDWFSGGQSGRRKE